MLLTKAEFEKLPKEKQDKFRLYKSLYEEKFLYFNDEDNEFVKFNKEANFE
jgi:hypothetical protein